MTLAHGQTLFKTLKFIHDEKEVLNKADKFHTDVGIFHTKLLKKLRELFSTSQIFFVLPRSMY